MRQAANESTMCKALSCALALLLSVCLLSVGPLGSAYATNPTDLAIQDAQAKVASTKLSLDEAKERLSEITSEYDALSKEIDKMQEKIDDLADRVLEAQEAMLAGRDALSSAAVYEYRNDIVSAMLNVLFGSESFSELMTNMSYIDMLMNHQAEEIAAQKKLKSELEAVSDELTAEKNEQESKLSELDRMQSEAQGIVDSISREYASETSYLQSLKEQAAQLKRAEAEVKQEIVPGATTINRPDSSSAEPSSSSAGSASAPSSAPASPSSKPASSNPAPSTSGEGWRTGRATAYGGSTDPWTPNPGRTATGAVCNDTSVGVAVPMAWSNYRSYFGRTVEIVYNGMTVYAPVNDCGGMQGGYISLDLQPGVFKAFGFSTCQAWGVRTVQYRFL